MNGTEVTCLHDLPGPSLNSKYSRKTVRLSVFLPWPQKSSRVNAVTCFPTQANHNPTQTPRREGKGPHLSMGCVPRNLRVCLNTAQKSWTQRLYGFVVLQQPFHYLPIKDSTCFRKKIDSRISTRYPLQYSV